MVTAEAAFKIIDQASEPIKKITSAGEIMDQTMKQAGKALDDIDSPKVTNSLKTTERNTKSLGDESTRAGKQIEQFTNKSGRNFEKMAAKGTASVEELTRALKHFEHERATATMDVDIAKAEAKIRLIKHELRTFTTMEAQKELEALGLVASSTTAKLTGGGIGGGGGGPPGTGGLAGGFLAAGGRMLFMAAAVATALPAIVALTGAVSALIGSLSLAVGGAGAIGIGILGAFVVGIGAIVSAVKPAITELKAVHDAQDKYNQAITQYGRKSAQAIAAEKALSAIRRKSPGAADVLRNAQVLTGRWKRSTAPARSDAFGIMNAGLQTLMEDLPTFSRITNRIMKSARTAVEDFLRPLRGPEWKSIFTTLGDTFARITGPGARAFGNVLLWLGRIAQAASPVVVRMFESLERWTSGLAQGVSNRERTTATVERLVGHLRDWVKFGASAVRLMAAFFGAGAQQGQSIVEGITKQFDKWTDWLHEHPQEVHDFFQRTIDSAGKLVDALGQIAKALGEIGDAMIPLLNLVSELVSATGGSLAPLALLGGARLALGKGFGMSRLMGGGAAAAGGAAAGRGAAAAGAGSMGVLGGARNTITAFRMGRAAQGTGAAAAGIARVGARGAAKFALPLTAGLAAWDFLSYRGNVAQRTQNALHGATFGLIHAPVSGAQQHDRGIAAAQQFIQRGPGAGTIRDRVATLQASLAERHDVFRGSGRGLGAQRTGTALVLRGGERQRVQAQLDALRPVLHAQVQLKAGRQGQKALTDIIDAFQIRWEHAGSRAARKGLLHDIEQGMKDLGPKGKRALLAGVADWTATMENGDRKQRRIARETKTQIVGIYKSMGQDIRVVQGKIVDVSAKGWASIAHTIGSAAERARYEATGAFSDIMKAAAVALRNLGFSGAESNAITEGLTKGGKAGRYAQNAVDLGAAGVHGRAQHAARATGDGWGIGDGPGISKHNLMGGRGAVAPVAGGRGGGALMGADPALGGYAKSAANYGLRVTSGRRPGSITESGNVSYHASGHAIDVSGPANDMMKFALHAASAWGPHLEELIHTPLGFSIKNGKRVAPYAQAAHYNHVHIADTHPTMAGGGMDVGGTPGALGEPPQVHLRGKRSAVGGSLGAASTRASQIIAAGATKKLNAILGADGGLAATGGGGGGVMTFNQVARLAESMGLPGVTFAQIAKGESGFNPKAVGHDPGGTQGLGLWQITTGYNDDIIARFGGREAMFNPRINAQAARAIFKRQGIGAWYGTRYMTGTNLHYGAGDGWGRPGTTNVEWGGWFGRGGDFVAHKPTVIGVGDSGSERVTIRSSGASSTGGRVLEVKIGKIVNYEEGDISDIIKRELNKVADDLDKGVGEDDELS